MIHKISVQQLTPGMYVTDLGLSQAEYPHVYCKPGLICTMEEIELMGRKGYAEAFVDEDKSTVEVDARTGWADFIEQKKEDDAERLRIPEPEEVQQHLEQAVTMYAAAIETAETLFSSIEKGKSLPMESVYDVANDVVQSILQNDMTLATITKLQSYDNYTFSHSVNVSVMATMFGRHLGLANDWLNQLATAGLMHDIGKLVIPHKLLNTARPLKDNEFEIMKQHSLAGYEEIQHIDTLSNSVKLAVLEHHERYNGSGYPHGKKGNEISFIGRMMSLVDVYDALTSKRVYKPALIPYTAVSFLYSQRGQHFEPSLVDRFIQSIGVYPVGSVLSLSNNEVGIVYQANPRHPLLPLLAVVLDENGAKCPLRMVDLSQDGAPKVKSCLEPAQVGINTSALLKACSWAQTENASQCGARGGASANAVSRSGKSARIR